MNWCANPPTDTFVGALQNQRSDVEVRWLPREHVPLNTCWLFFMPTLLLMAAVRRSTIACTGFLSVSRTSTPAYSCHPLCGSEIGSFLKLPRFFAHEKIKSQSPLSPADSDPVDAVPLSEITEPAVSARLRNPSHTDPISHVFTITPGVDSTTLLSHACETLASLNVLITDLACKLEGSKRNVALSIQQLAVIAELLVNQALDNVDPPEGAPVVQPPIRH